LTGFGNLFSASSLLLSDRGYGGKGSDEGRDKRKEEVTRLSTYQKRGGNSNCLFNRPGGAGESGALERGRRPGVRPTTLNQLKYPRVVTGEGEDKEEVGPRKHRGSQNVP